MVLADVFVGNDRNDPHAHYSLTKLSFPMVSGNARNFQRGTIEWTGYVMNRDDDPGGIEWTSLCRYGYGSKLRRPLIVGWLEYQTCSQRCGNKIGTLNLSHSHVAGIHSPILFGPHQPVVLGGRLDGYPMPFLHHDSVENDPSLYGERSSCRDPPFRLNHDNRSKDRCY